MSQNPGVDHSLRIGIAVKDEGVGSVDKTTDAIIKLRNEQARYERSVGRLNEVVNRQVDIQQHLNSNVEVSNRRQIELLRTMTQTRNVRNQQVQAMREEIRQQAELEASRGRFVRAEQLLNRLLRSTTANTRERIQVEQRLLRLQRQRDQETRSNSRQLAEQAIVQARVAEAQGDSARAMNILERATRDLNLADRDRIRLLNQLSAAQRRAQRETQQSADSQSLLGRVLGGIRATLGAMIPSFQTLTRILASTVLIGFSIRSAFRIFRSVVVDPIRDLVTHTAQATEEFRRMEAAMLGVMGTMRAVRDLSRDAMAAARDLPLTAQQAIGTVQRGLLIPAIAGRFQQPGAERVDFAGDVMRILEGLAIIDPTQGLEGAAFAFRQALAGQFRSLQFRFEIAPEIIAGAIGRDLRDLRTDPLLTVEALQRFTEIFVGEEALQEFQNLMSTQGELFRGVLNEFFNLIGDSGIYDRITNTIRSAVEALRGAVRPEVDPQSGEVIGDAPLARTAARISDRLDALMDSLLGTASRLLQVFTGVEFDLVRAIEDADVGALGEILEAFVNRLTGTVETFASGFANALEVGTQMFRAAVPIMQRTLEFLGFEPGLEISDETRLEQLQRQVAARRRDIAERGSRFGFRFSNLIPDLMRAANELMRSPLEAVEAEIDRLQQRIDRPRGAERVERALQDLIPRSEERVNELIRSLIESQFREIENQLGLEQLPAHTEIPRGTPMSERVQISQARQSMEQALARSRDVAMEAQREAEQEVDRHRQLMHMTRQERLELLRREIDQQIQMRRANIEDSQRFLERMDRINQVSEQATVAGTMMRPGGPGQLGVIGDGSISQEQIDRITASLNEEQRMLDDLVEHRRHILAVIADQRSIRRHVEALDDLRMSNIEIRKQFEQQSQAFLQSTQEMQRFQDIQTPDAMLRQLGTAMDGFFGQQLPRLQSAMTENIEGVLDQVSSILGRAVDGLDELQGLLDLSPHEALERGLLPLLDVTARAELERAARDINEIQAGFASVFSAGRQRTRDVFMGIIQGAFQALGGLSPAARATGIEDIFQVTSQMFSTGDDLFQRMGIDRGVGPHASGVLRELERMRGRFESEGIEFDFEPALFREFAQAARQWVNEMREMGADMESVAEQGNTFLDVLRDIQDEQVRGLNAELLQAEARLMGESIGAFGDETAEAQAEVDRLREATARWQQLAPGFVDAAAQMFQRVGAEARRERISEILREDARRISEIIDELVSEYDRLGRAVDEQSRSVMESLEILAAPRPSPLFAQQRAAADAFPDAQRATIDRLRTQAQLAEQAALRELANVEAALQESFQGMLRAMEDNEEALVADYQRQITTHEREMRRIVETIERGAEDVRNAQGQFQDAQRLLPQRRLQAAIETSGGLRPETARQNIQEQLFQLIESPMFRPEDLGLVFDGIQQIESAMRDLGQSGSEIRTLLQPAFEDLEQVIRNLPGATEEAVNEMLERLEVFREGVGQTANDIERIFDQMAETVTRSIQAGLVDSVVGLMRGSIDDIRSAIVSMLDAVSRAIVDAIIEATIINTIVRPFVGNLGGAIGGGLAGLGSEFGNVLSPSGGATRIVPHADGGMIDRPSAFAMTGGRIGTAAERDREVIMPVSRDASGRMGVLSADDSGGGRTGRTVTVIMNVNNPTDVDGMRRARNQLAREFAKQFERANRQQ